MEEKASGVYRLEVRHVEMLVKTPAQGIGRQGIEPRQSAEAACAADFHNDVLRIRMSVADEGDDAAQITGANLSIDGGWTAE